MVGERENSAEEEGVISHDVAGEALGEAGAEEEGEEGEGEIPGPSSRSPPDRIPLIARVLEGALHGACTGLCVLSASASASSKGRTGVALAGRRKLGSSSQSVPSRGVGSIVRSGRALLAREMLGSIEIESREIRRIGFDPGCTPARGGGGRGSREGNAKEEKE